MSDRIDWLASDANPDEWTRAGYRELVARLAAGGAPPGPPPNPGPAPIFEPAPLPDDETLRAYLAAHPCGGCH